MMARNTTSLQDATELPRLYDELLASTSHTANILRSHGSGSPEFQEASKSSDILWTRIREIRAGSNSD
jgi:hypothetical protein